MSEKISAAAGGGQREGPRSSYHSGMTVFSYIAGGIAVWTLIGWLVGITFHAPWFALVGGLVGAAGGSYLAFAPRFSPSRGEASGKSGAGQTGAR